MKSDRSTSPLIPGFDFLKTLASQAGKGIEGLNQLNTLSQGLGAGINGLSNLGSLSGLGGFKQWVAPTLDPDELEKRIEELRTVQFWLEQNARMLGATIQALEVQKMTLSTLRSMNVKMPDLQQVLGAMVPPAGSEQGRGAEGAGPSAAPYGASASRAGSGGEPGAKDEAVPKKSASNSRKARAAGKMGQAAAAGEAAAGLVDPMKWWGALTEQFQSLAAQALAAAPGIAPTSAAGKASGRAGNAGDARPSGAGGAKTAPGSSTSSQANTSGPSAGQAAAPRTRRPGAAHATRTSRATSKTRPLAKR